MSNSIEFPTEVVDLPSQGLLYSSDSPLSSGKIEMKYMTAKEEDILTNQNYIEKGIVIDKLLESLIVDKKINYSDLLTGDKNALLVAARILGYGQEYTFEYGGKEHTVDLSTLQNKEIDLSLFSEKKNEFGFELPASKIMLTFKLLTHGDEVKIDEEIAGLKKINKEASADLSTRLKHMITSVNGDSSQKAIREFVDTRFLVRDSRAFRQYYSSILPDVDLRFYPDNGPEGGVAIPIGITFLWPDFEL